MEIKRSMLVKYANKINSNEIDALRILHYGTREKIVLIDDLPKSFPYAPGLIKDLQKEFPFEYRR